MSIRPLHDRIVVKRIEAKDSTVGGPFIPDSAADGIRLDTEEAPQRQRVKEQDAQTELDKTRLVNKEHFRP